jgi:SHS2 domain-containing protein
VTNTADFVEVEHTADWAIRVRGKTLSELFINVAIGIYSLVVDLPFRKADKAEIERMVEVEGVDPETLLINWLNELLYHTEMDNEVFSEFEMECFEATRLRATVRGCSTHQLKKHIKAATFNDLCIIPTENGYEATVVFDV